MNTLSLELATVYAHLTSFAGLASFWASFNTAFGSEYDLSKAENLRLQWLNQDFSQLPTIRVLDSGLDGTLGAYAQSTNTIYLSQSFLEAATPAQIQAVLIEEMGHFVDTLISSQDSPGDEGELFSLLVRGITLTASELNRLQSENDRAIITIDGQQVDIEQAFAAPTDFATGNFPESVAVGDFNGDGKLDLAIATLTNDTVSVLLRKSDNTGFEPKTDFATGLNPKSVAVGDFNGDGKLDLAIANRVSASTVSILLRKSDNTGFEPKTDFAVGDNPYSVAVGDFNGDGKLDLATASFNSDTVSVLLRKSDNTGFEPKTDFATGDTPVSVAVGDFNGDGKLDLATANQASNNVSILLRKSDNTGFEPKTDFATGNFPESVAVGDFNRDGKPDLATANQASNNVSILLRKNDNTGFEPKTDFAIGFDPGSVAVGDFNGDGKIDIATANLASNNVSILLRKRDNTGFEPKTDFATGFNPRSVAVGDFNGDGKLDLATANFNSDTVSVLQNVTPKVTITAGTTPVEGGIVGTYTITLDTPAPTGGLVVNFNTTGSTATLTTDYTLSAGTNLANVTANTFTITAGQTTATLSLNAVADAVDDPSETVQINLTSGGDYILGQNSTALLSPKTDFATGFNPRSVAVGDFNGDGKLDLATANFSGNNISVVMGDGSGGFGNATNFPVATNPTSVVVGDFNGDGKLDLATANNGSNNISVVIGNVSGGFGTATNFPVGNGPFSVAVGDFNGDGKLDLATANFSGNNISVVMGDGSGGFGTATNFIVGHDPISVAVGDFNRDGKLDLVTANFSSNNISVVIGDGSGGFGTATNFPVGSIPRSVAVGDFNRDGKLDLAVANQDGDSISVVIGDGSGGFGTATNFIVGNGPFSVVVGDFNEDSKLDLATANHYSNSASVLVGDGSGDFSAATNFTVATNPTSVVVEDFNGDGKHDLAIANTNSSNISVLLNTDPGATLTITDANEAPINSLPDSQITNEDTALVFSTGNSNPISISDIDAGSNPVQVALSVTNGVLTLSGTTELDFVNGSNGSSSFTIQGTVANINSALNGLTYLGNSNYNGADSLTITTNDLGNIGPGGALTDTDAVPILVNSINDDPTITSGATGTVAENAPITTVVYDANASDPDTTAPNNTLSFSLSGTDASLFTIDSGDGEVRLKNPANFEVQISYSIDVVVIDGGNPALSDTKTVTIQVLDAVERVTTPNQDSINTGPGNDFVTTTLDNLRQRDSVNGGTGNDTLVLNGPGGNTPLEINLSNSSQVLVQPNFIGLPIPFLFFPVPWSRSSVKGFENVDASGFTGNLHLTGSNLSQTLKGGSGADRIFGLGGDDLIDGGVGADELTGGLGNDMIYLGNDSARDKVYYSAGDGKDTVFQFDQVNDQIIFSGIGNSINLLETMGNTQIQDQANNVLMTLVDVTGLTANSSNFVFL